jgi:hypothetical protein
MVTGQKYPRSCECFQGDLESPQGFVGNRDVVEAITRDKNGVYSTLLGEQRDPLNSIKTCGAQSGCHSWGKLPKILPNLEVGCVKKADGHGNPEVRPAFEGIAGATRPML